MCETSTSQRSSSQQFQGLRTMPAGQPRITSISQNERGRELPLLVMVAERPGPSTHWDHSKGPASLSAPKGWQPLHPQPSQPPASTSSEANFYSPAHAPPPELPISIG